MATSPVALEIVPMPVVVATADNKVYQFPDAETAADFEDKVREAGGTTLRLLPASAPRPGATQSLYEVEDHLAAMVDTEELVSLNQEEAFVAELQTAMTAAVEKRDRVGQFFGHCESQVTLAKQEIDRLKKRLGLYERALERMESYVAMVIVANGTDAKGKFRKLEGNTVTFSVRRNPPSVMFHDEAKVPATCKSVTITLPAPTWEAVLESVPWEVREALDPVIKRVEFTTSKELVKAEIEAVVPDWKELLKDKPAVFCDKVPGAAIAAGSLRLVRE